MAANFDVVAGDTKTLEVDVKNAAGEAVNIAAASGVTWSFSRIPFGAAVLTKTLGSGVTVTNGAGGIFQVRLDAADTLTLAGVYYHFARIALGSEIATIFTGAATVLPGGKAISVDMLVARFPEFVAVNRTMLQMVIDEVSPGIVNAGWMEADQVPAILYLVAHKLAVEGEPGRSVALAAGGSGVDNGPIKRRKVGDVETEYQNANERFGTGSAGAIGGSGFELTAYGRQYLQIARRNRSTILAV